MRYVYPAKLVRQREGGYLVRIPDVPEALTEGETREQALAEAQDALAAALSGYVLARRKIPVPSRVKAGQPAVYLPSLIAAKLALYQTMREQRINNVALAKRLGISETAVRRLVHPDHASRIDKVEEAMATLGKRLIVEAA